MALFNTALIGCGFMGLGLLQCLRRAPARTRVAVALREFSLRLAAKNGADHGLLSTGPDVVGAIERPLVERGEAFDHIHRMLGPLDGFVHCRGHR